ncbi:MAG TPA: hypothetical protein PKD53_00505 [Chloroflexaceae bacterium]|nr:hypothetical protein [Chloroflexaceae bacterium]
MSLFHIFKELYATAIAGRPAFRRLKSGATIKVRAKGRRRQVILGRAGAPVGEGEEQTFRRDGEIPDAAARQEYQSGPWHYVALTWEEPPGLFDEEPTDA